MDSDPASKEPAPPDGNPPKSGQSVRNRIAELQEYFSYYTAARIDLLKSSVRRALLWTAIALVGGAVVLVLIATSLVLIVLGISDGFTRVLGSRAWGDLVTGAIFLTILLGGMVLGITAMQRAARSRTIAKYEARRRQQREKFGRDVSDDAANGNDPQQRG